jgi:hypothetical protein
MIEGSSINVIGTCPSASVAVICRVRAVQAAKHVTIPVQSKVLWLDFHAALSAILFNKVKNIDAIYRNLHEFWLEQLWLN